LLLQIFVDEPLRRREALESAKQSRGEARREIVMVVCLLRSRTSLLLASSFRGHGHEGGIGGGRDSKGELVNERRGGVEGVCIGDEGGRGQKYETAGGEMTMLSSDLIPSTKKSVEVHHLFRRCHE
jgi:hypothetical protein